jgi:hypothetical protein
MPLEFGYFPRRYDHTIGEIVIATLPGLDSKIEFVNSHEWTDRGWISVPHHKRVFRLPKTHSISCARPGSDERLQFLLWCFGFFVGMRMDWTEAGFLDATPIEERAMIDIFWLGDSLEKAIAGVDAFWHKHVATPRITKVLAGAIHSYFLAQTRHLLEFEQFIYMYTAFEGCHFVRETLEGREPRATFHGQRVKKLCEAFGIAVPAWADPTTSEHIVGIRNVTLHEGLFFDEPLGFRGFSGQVLDHQVRGPMLKLISRLCVALLELPAHAYIVSPITSRPNEGVQL